jgi:hypothetical protein
MQRTRMPTGERGLNSPNAIPLGCLRIGECYKLQLKYTTSTDENERFIDTEDKTFSF